jgi:OmpA-OmpF porin, OOP family
VKLNSLNTKKIAGAIALAFCAGSGALATAASSDDVVNPSWYVQPSVNGIKPDRDFGTDKRGWGGGLRFGKPVSDMWDIQFGPTYARSNDGAAHYDQTTFGLDGLLMFSRKNVRPFLLLGIGAERDNVENPLRNLSKTSPYLSAGLGLQVGLSDQWSLQADLRTVRGRLRDSAAFGFSRSNDKYLTVGLNYAFEKPAQPAPPPPPPAPVAETPPPPPPPPAPPPPPPPRFEKITLSATELFAFDSATLSMPQPKLDEIANALNSDTSVNNIVVTGYADRLGSAKYNVKLSERRANAVRDYLIGKGVAASRLTAVGKGEANPVVTCHNKKRADLIKCLEPNRRVEVEQLTIERRVQ